MEIKKNGKIFFPIGINLPGWKDSVTVDVFNSLINTYNVLYVGKGEVQNQRKPIIDRTVINIPDTNSNGCVFLTGDSHLHWRLKYDTTHGGINQDSCENDNDSSDYIGPRDQREWSDHLDSFEAQNYINEIADYFSPRGNFVYSLSDEPDRGAPGNCSWYFHNDLLEYFHNRTKLPQTNYQSLTFLCLGPMSGNKYFWEKNPQKRTPGNNLDSYGDNYHCSCTLATSLPIEYIYEQNVKRTADYYKNACDIMGINSYSQTISKPWRLGQAVTWIDDTTAYKPVWVWVQVKAPVIPINNICIK